ncbi:unnamed protein product [Tetraodon nigroviridis]|uniref:(spotted green pufferfish) hypothetical protein n=1 Tax=Tetraodon nigroviridis TaxID=99883 RepID=Q4RPE1_TETNG|nr:unnamed protein product [Tetraodon nigroviridis]
MLCTVTPSFNMTMKTSAFMRVAYSSPVHMNNKQLRKIAVVPETHTLAKKHAMVISP